MDIQNNSDNKESNTGEETDGNIADDGQFIKYENSVYRLRKRKDKRNTATTEKQKIKEKEMETKNKAIKTEKLLELIRSQSGNKIQMWQSFPASGDINAVVFCYESHHLKGWMNLNAIAFEEKYQLTLTEQEIILKTEENKNSCREQMQGISYRGVTRTYRVPKTMDYGRAVWHQAGNVLEICVPWCTPLG